jgi:thioredoxin 2
MNNLIHIVCPSCRTTNRLLSKRLSEHPKCGKCQKSLFNGVPLVLDLRTGRKNTEPIRARARAQ